MKNIIGKLNKRIEILQLNKVDNELGGFNENWIVLKKIWAGINPINTDNILVIDRIENTTTHLITIRWTEQINIWHRVRYNNRIFIIKSIINPNENNRILELKCEEKIEREKLFYNS